MAICAKLPVPAGLESMALVQRLADIVVGVFMGGLIGEVPKRQPWRGIVLALYGVLALAGVAVCAWAIGVAL